MLVIVVVAIIVCHGAHVHAMRESVNGAHRRGPSLETHQRIEGRRAQGATLVEPARSYDVGKSTISRLAG